MNNFTTPCFIRKNTPELRAKLEEMGIEKSNFYGGFTFTNYMAVSKGTWFANAYTNVDLLKLAGYHDCGENEELFLALAGLRSDSKATPEKLIERFTNAKD